MLLIHAAVPGFILAFCTSGQIGHCHATHIGESHWLITRISLTRLRFMVTIAFFISPRSPNFAFLAA